MTDVEKETSLFLFSLFAQLRNLVRRGHRTSYESLKWELEECVLKVSNNRRTGCKPKSI